MPPPMPQKKPLQMPNMPPMGGQPLDLKSLVMGGPQMQAGAGTGGPRPMPAGAPAQMPPMSKEALMQAIAMLLAETKKPNAAIAPSAMPPPQEPPSAYKGK